MIDPIIKILFDENWGENVVKALAQVFAWHEEPVTIKHLFDFAKTGEADEDWIPRIADEGWIVITGDRGRCGGGKKLPDLCVIYKVTHILVSPSVQKAKRFEKMRVILVAWPHLSKLAGVEKGSRYYLRYDGHEKRVKLTDRADSGRIKGKPIHRVPFKSTRKKPRSPKPKKIRDRYAGHPTLPFPEKT